MNTTETTTKEPTAEEIKIKAAVDAINKVMQEHDVLLQPYMHRGELFDIPSVRIVLRPADGNMAAEIKDAGSK